MQEYIFNIVLGSGQTNKTLFAQILDTNGQPLGDPIYSGFLEIGFGQYSWTYSFQNGFTGYVKISSDSDLTVTVSAPIQVSGLPALIIPVSTGDTRNCKVQELTKLRKKLESKLTSLQALPSKDNPRQGAIAIQV